MPTDKDKKRFWETFMELKLELQAIAFKVDLMWKAFLAVCTLILSSVVGWGLYLKMV